MIYTIYRITNLLDGKIYIGKHQTKNLNDGYMGSGKHIKRAIVKYGIENFSKEILFQFDNSADMNAKETELVTEQFCMRADTYNIAVGGQGGFSYLDDTGSMVYPLDRPGVRLAGRKAADAVILAKRGKLGRAGHQVTPELRKKISDGVKRHISINGSNWAGKCHTATTRQKMSKSKNVGDKNSQFGSMWITNGKANKKIQSADPIPIGWYRGRVSKKIGVD